MDESSPKKGIETKKVVETKKAPELSTKKILEKGNVGASVKRNLTILQISM
jgi:hypothetical protein